MVNEHKKLTFNRLLLSPGSEFSVVSFLVELKEEVVTVGKLTTCEVSITSEEVPGNFWVVISRKHFSISRIQQEVLGKTISAVQLTDLSMNGTFINGRKVGKGQSKDLEDNDLIAVGKPQFKGTALQYCTFILLLIVSIIWFRITMSLNFCYQCTTTKKLQ